MRKQRTKQQADEFQRQRDEQTLEFYIQSARQVSTVIFDVRQALLDGHQPGDDAVTLVDAVELSAKLHCAEALLEGAIRFHEYGRP